MSVDLDHPSPECAECVRLLEAATTERNRLLDELTDVIGKLNSARDIIKSERLAFADLAKRRDRLIILHMAGSIAAGLDPHDLVLPAEGIAERAVEIARAIIAEVDKP